MVTTRSGCGRKAESDANGKEVSTEYLGSEQTDLSRDKRGTKRKNASKNQLTVKQPKKAKTNADPNNRANGRKIDDALNKTTGVRTIEKNNTVLKTFHKNGKESTCCQGYTENDELESDGLQTKIEDTTAYKESVKTEHTPVKKVGAHVSISGGLHNSVQNALDLNAYAFGLFLRNQRQWAAKPLTDEEAEKFKQAFQGAGFSPNNILPHGIYLMNCASPDDDTLSKSRDALVDELKRCERLGLTLYNFHPGSTCGKITADEGIQRIAESINTAHKQTKYVITLIENMCCQGHTIGGKFEELKSIIDKVDDKARIGVCFDTCHAFAAGYDITNTEALNHTMETFEKVIGLEYLKAVHLNDSKGGCGCHLDRHENIGHGKIGPKGFKALMNDNRFNGIPMILETPECDYRKEIKKLYSLVCT